MKRIDFEDFVSYVIEEDASEFISINGSMMMKVRRELLSAGIICDFSPSAINTFAYHHPQCVTVSHFEIKVTPNPQLSNRLGSIRTENEVIKTRISAIWKDAKIQNEY